MTQAKLLGSLLAMKQRISWLLVLTSLILLGLMAIGYGYFRWIRFESIDEMVVQGHQLAGPHSSQAEALLTLVESEDTSLEDKNQAVWALGELGDPAVLPRLRELDRFQECDHGTRICAYELKKAIGKLERSAR